MRILVSLALAALVGTVVHQWHGWSLDAAVHERLPSPVAESPAGPESPALPAGRSLAAIAEFAVVSERPLFSPDRRPPQVEDKPVEVAASGRPALHISAIVGVEDDFQARVDPPGGQSLRLAVGGEYQGWTVSEIRPDRMVLTLGDRSEVYELRPAPQSAAAQADNKGK